MGLKDTLRLKFFGSSELVIRAMKTLKGDPPYLTLVISVSPLRTVSVVAGDKGKAAGSSSVQGSHAEGSKVILYGSEHLSVEDEESTGEGGDVVVLEDDLDRAMEFSASEASLNNLSSHLHGGKTPRDRSFNLVSNLLSFSGSYDAMDVDSAEALEKYVSDWLLVNKD
ncbi:hypothetical protein Hanom_Chr12g01156631 [Helianthus anomalus]